MAQRHDTKIVSPSKGLYMDGLKNSQPENTYSFALNAVKDSEENEKNSLSSELGNKSIFSLPSGFNLIGSINAGGNSALLISATTDKFEIGLQEDERYTQIIRSQYDSDLFDIKHLVKGVFRIFKGCERVFYFITPKLLVINIDDLEQYLLPGYTVETANSTEIGWDLDNFKLFPNYSYPIIDDITVNNSGGSLLLGTYNITITYLTDSLNEIGWGEFSQTIPIVDESLSANVNTIDGGLSIPTGKSITVSFTNLDVSFPFLRIGVVASNDGVKTGYKVIDLPITSEEQSYTISSLENATTVSINELTINSVIFDSAEDIEQYRKRLLLAGVEEPNYDLSAFQQAANNVKITWVSDKKVMNSSLGGGETNGHKSTRAYLLDRSYMRDEVYALGLVAVFKNGYVTPALHIPGRPKNTGYHSSSSSTLPASFEVNTYHNRLAPTTGWDDTSYTIGTDISLEETKHTGTLSGTIERWKVFNTAIKYDETSGFNYASGEMSYWESSIAYPNDLDCDGNRIYPEGNIRHHKFPDATLLNIADEDHVYSYTLGIKVDNIVTPSGYEDIVAGYYIVRVKRDDTNTSVVDKGLFTRTLHNTNSATVVETTSGDFTEQSCLFQPFGFNGEITDMSTGAATTATVANSKYQCIHVPRAKFFKDNINSNYFKVERLYKTKLPSDISFGSSSYYTTFPGLTTTFYYWLQTGSDSVEYIPTFTNRTIDIQAFVDADTLLENVFEARFNNTEQQETYVAHFTDNVPDPSSSETELSGYGGNYVYYYFGSLKNYIADQYGQLNGLVYIPASSFIEYSGSGTVSAEVFGGDTFVSPLYMRRNANIFFNGTSVSLPFNTPYVPDSTWSRIYYRSILKFPVESTINCGMRHEGTEETDVYFPKSYSADLSSAQQFALLEATLSGLSIYDTDLIPNYYAFNNDFIQQPDSKIYVPVRTGFDWCNSCTNNFTRRVVYSEQITEEDISDSYRIFLSNNYIDLSGNKGEIRSIFVNDDRLFVNTEHSLWLLPNDNRILEDSTGGTIKIGTGAFFSLPPIEIKSLSGGYMGTNQKFSIVNTEFGTIFNSYDKYFLIGKEIREISDQGLKDFFRDNILKLEKKYFEVTGENYPYINSNAYDYGVGYIACYDSSKKRYIVHKKDFLPLLDFKLVGVSDITTSVNVGDFVFNIGTGSWQTVTDVIGHGSSGLFLTGQNVSFTDTTYFENCSYTLSYDCEENFWVSFHSYFPNFMYNTYNKWFSKINTLTGLYEHNKGTYQNYYESVKDHIIELVATENILTSQTSKSLSFVSQTKTFDETYRQWRNRKDKTFNKIWMYNDFQSTNMLDVSITNSTPFAAIDYDVDVVYLYNAENTWRFSAKRNLVPITNTLPISTNKWSDISSEYFIDKVPNSLAHDATISRYNLSKMRDKYLTVRLIREGEKDQDYKLVTQYSLFNHKHSTR